MIKRIIFLLVVFVLLSPVSVLAAGSDNGVIEGRIINGTDGGSNVADQEIVLKTNLMDEESGNATMQTAADGAFTFTGLSTEAGFSYQIMIVFQKAEYLSDWIVFEEGETVKSVEITIYDSTTGAENISITTGHTIITSEQKSLIVKNFYVFLNDSDLTYIGNKEPSDDAGLETLKFSLPEGAAELEFISGLKDCCIVFVDDGFISTIPVFPGTTEINYAYRVNYDSSAYTYSEIVNYPMQNYILLVGGGEVAVDDPRMIVGDPIEVEGISYNYVGGERFSAGDVLTTEISGLSAEFPGLSTEMSDLSTGGTRTYAPWIALIVALLIAAAVFFYLAERKKEPPVAGDESPEQEKQRLLVEIAGLDDDFESGEITEETYRKLRTETKSRLVELVDGMEEE